MIEIIPHHSTSLQTTVGRNISYILSKVTDELLFVGHRDAVNSFIDAVKNSFEVSKAIIDETVLFNVCRITQAPRVTWV